MSCSFTLPLEADAADIQATWLRTSMTMLNVDVFLQLLNPCFYAVELLIRVSASIFALKLATYFL